MYLKFPVNIANEGWFAYTGNICFWQSSGIQWYMYMYIYIQIYAYVCVYIQKYFENSPQMRGFLKCFCYTAFWHASVHFCIFTVQMHCHKV